MSIEHYKLMCNSQIVDSDSNPLVSVIMSVYNAEQFVGEAIDSILQQTYQKFEFIIIDDASKDQSNSIIKSYNDSRIRIHVNEKNLGLTLSLNIGLSFAKGIFIARQDADDVSHTTRFQKQLDFFRANPSLDIVGTQAHYIYEGGSKASGFRIRKPLSGSAIKLSLIYDSPFIHSTVMFKRDCIWAKLNGYNKLFRTSQDFELWSRASRELSLANMSEKLLNFRIVKNSVSSNYKEADLYKLIPIYLANCIQSGLNKKQADVFVSFLFNYIFRKQIEVYNYNIVPKFLFKNIRRIISENCRIEKEYSDEYFYVQTLLFFFIKTFPSKKNMALQFLLYAFLLNPFLFFTIITKELISRYINLKP